MSMPVLKRVKPLGYQPPQQQLRKLTRKVNKLYKDEEVVPKDTNIALSVSYDLNQATLLTNIPVGTGDGTRVGRAVNPRFLEIRGYVHAPPLAGLEADTMVRLMVIQCKQRFIPNTASAATNTSVLTQQNTTNVPFSPFDVNNRDHFYVLHDETILIGANSTNSYGYRQVEQFHVKRKLSRKISYLDDGTTSEAGAIYFLAYSSIAAASTEPALFAVSRVTYTD